MGKISGGEVTAQFITTDVSKANDLLRIGWKVASHQITAAVSTPDDTGGLTDMGLSRTMNEAKITARTFVLELENAKNHRRPFKDWDCRGCEDCNYTGWVKEIQ